MENFEFTPSTFDEEINENEFNEKAYKLINEIVKEQFHSINGKNEMIDRDERFNFACPYCGDSAKDNFKKRGNVYKKGWNFHCFNCKTHTSFEEFLKDFGKTIKSNEIIYVRNRREIYKIRDSKKIIDNSYFFNIDKLKKYAIDKNLILKKYKLIPIEHREANWAKRYLISRHQFNFDLFAWDPNLKRLFILNLIDENKVLGIQVRNFKNEPKYVTHTLEMIYKHIGLEYEHIENFKDINKLSFLFGLNTTNFSLPIIVTEGPLDSFLLNNAMSICGIDNEFPFEVANLRWMYDRDDDGIKKSMKKIINGEYVFLWKKYIKDVGIDINFNKIDFNDIVIQTKKQNKNLISVGGYFSNSKYDANHI